MTQVIIEIKNLVKKLPCLGIPNPNADLIIETDASDIGYGEILKQKIPDSSKEQVVKYHSGIWHLSQQKYSTVKKEILSIVLCVQKFQDDVFNKKFLIRTDYKAAPILEPLTDQYVDKPELLPIMTLESYMIKEDLKTLIAHIFLKTFNYLPNNLLKTQRFCEFILVDTYSAKITHTRDDQGNILFSNMKIMNILSPQDCDQPLFDSKSFSRSFNPT
ncbi:Enzymatic polyprotein, partial [Mucuna pruriens]